MFKTFLFRKDFTNVDYINRGGNWETPYSHAGKQMVFIAFSKNELEDELSLIKRELNTKIPEIHNWSGPRWVLCGTPDTIGRWRG